MIGLIDNDDTKITSDELSMVNRAGSWGTVQELKSFYNLLKNLMVFH